MVLIGVVCFMLQFMLCRDLNVQCEVVPIDDGEHSTELYNHQLPVIGSTGLELPGEIVRSGLARTIISFDMMRRKNDKRIVNHTIIMTKMRMFSVGERASDELDNISSYKTASLEFVTPSIISYLRENINCA